MAAATGLIAGAARSVLLHGSTDVVGTLTEPLAAAAARPACHVAVLVPGPVPVRGCELTLTAAPAPDTPSWLQLVCDRRRWLVARAGGEPAGCGGDQPTVAAVLADGLDVARRAGGLQAELAALAAVGGAADRTVRPAARSATPQPAEPAPERRTDAGLTFIIRHEDKDAT